MPKIHCLAGLIAVLTLGLMACSSEEAPPLAPVPAAPVASPDPWVEFIDRELEAHLAAHPAWAVSQGRHEYDGQLPDWSEAGLKREAARLKAARRAARAFAPEALRPEQQYQRDYFISRIDHDLFWLEKARWPMRNPQFYLGWMSDSLDPSPYLTLDYAPPAERMAAFTRYLEAIPEAAKHIRANLRMPMPESWLQLGVDAFGGYASYFRDEVPAAWAAVDDSALQQRFSAANARAIAAMQGLADWLESSRNIADQNFALGEALYKEMLWDTERVRIDLETLEQLARRDMARNVAALRQACGAFAPGREIPDCVAQMAARKPAGGSVAAAQAQLQEIYDFMRAQDLVSVPGEEVARVAEAPPYARSNFAYIAIPGPWESGQPSTYYIAPPNPAWPEAVQAGFIPGESDLLFTSIHEVWPGHFLNFMHANRAGWQYGRAMVSYAFAEGWAHYTEAMMLEAGLRDADAETRIGQLSNALLRNARFVASLGLHTQGWSVAQAQRFFQQEAYQGEGMAMQQAARGTWDPAYLNYTMGKLLIQRLRDDWTATRGGRAAWRDFHDEFLSYGGPPIPLVRQQMLQEPSPQALFPALEAPPGPSVPEAVPVATAPLQDHWAWDCDDGSYLVTSRTDAGIKLYLSSGPAELVAVPAASGARYENEELLFWNRGDEALLETVLGSANCRINRYHSAWENARLRGALLRAVGNEPGWSLELFQPGESVLETDYGERQLRFSISGSEALLPGPGRRYEARVDGETLSILVTPGPCADTMADISYQSRVTVQLGDRRLRGCGNALQ